MESTIHQASKSAYVIIGPEGATNFAIVKGANGAAVERNINQFLTGKWF